MTNQLLTTLHLIKALLDDRLDARFGPRDRGSVTTEYVLWAVAVVALVGGVVLVLNNFVEGKAALIK